jgi:hypothetical protein
VASCNNSKQCHPITICRITCSLQEKVKNWSSNGGMLYKSTGNRSI